MRILIPLSILLASCAIGAGGPRAAFVPTNPTPGPLSAKWPNQVTIASTPPNRPFYEIGFIDGWQGSAFDDEAAVLAQMRVAAAQRGCDVLLVTGPNNDVSGYAHGSTSTTFGYHAACIVLGEPSPPPPPVAPLPQPEKPAVASGLLFRNAEGTVFRVQPDGREAALRMGWVEVKPGSAPLR
jgi:hypothetical protein